MARGTGRFWPIRAKALVVADCSVARLGAPCERNSAGSFACLERVEVSGHASAALIGADVWLPDGCCSALGAIAVSAVFFG